MAGNRVEKAAALLSSFRFYLDYHIKSSKTFLHGRMRNRAEQWKNCRVGKEGLTVVLKEAKFEEMEVQKTTISGKTFNK